MTRAEFFDLAEAATAIAILFSPSTDDADKAQDDLEDELALIFILAALDAGQRFQLSYSPAQLHDAALAFAALHGAEVASQLSQTTRETVTRLLADARRNGWDAAEFAAALDKSGVFGEDRLDLIALNEFIYARNRGAAAAYGAAGVEKVRIFDGILFDQPCRNVNGTIQPLQWWIDNPLEHPNCQRSASPYSFKEAA